MAIEPQDPPRIPNARCTRHLGSGGFADVFLYRQSMPERDIAVKVLRQDVSEEQNGAFEAEANLMARMSAHPAILSVFGAGVSEDGRPYLIMEYCPPPPKGQRASEQRRSVPRVLDIGIRLAGAVETLHRSGILHRDIKPGNILVTQFGHPVLTDFGIAASTSPGADQADSGFSIPWAPPEQIVSARDPGPTLDVYSLAATVYTFLAGRSPFEIPGGDNRDTSMINRILHSQVPRTGREDSPLELERILAIAMAKDPAQRYQSALDFAHALQQIQADMHQRATPMDVLETENSQRIDDDDEEATRARPIQFVDPHLNPDNSAETSSRVPGSGVMPEWTAPSIPPRAAREDVAPPPPPPAEPPRMISPLHSESRDADGDSVDELDKPRRLGRRMAMAVAAVGVVAVLVFGGWTVFRGEGGTFATATASPGSDPAELPVVSTVEGVTGLKGAVEGDKVRFSWESTAEDPSFLYTLVDPLETHQVRETAEKSIAVDPLDGRTCLQVMVRDASGQTSVPTTECVETP